MGQSFVQEHMLKERAGVTNGDAHDHAGGDGGQIDHGGLAGLADDDHTQYFNATRHDADDHSAVDHGGILGLADDDHTQYLNTTRHDAHDHSSVMSTVVAADLSDITDWQDWSPTLSNLTLGNGTQVSRYAQIMGTVFVEFEFILGSTSSVSGNPTITVPVTPLTATGGTAAKGACWLIDDSAGASGRFVGTLRVSTTAFILGCHNVGSTYAFAANLSSTVPFTWATGDTISFFAVYEAA